MGISFSCPFATYSDLENSFESVIVNSINFENNEARSTLRSISFKDQGKEAVISQSTGSGRMIEGLVSFKSRELESTTSVEAFSSEEDSASITSVDAKSSEMGVSSSLRIDSMRGKLTQVLDLGSPKHEAAIKLQKVYKSFRTRRKLADCAVLIEQSWWKLLDFAELKHSSISFFDLEKHETAISRWSRARTRAAKVGKGLSKNGKARKLALQHWLEAIDPRHRYGHNLHFYYVKWLHSQSKEPFFYWLDIGEGKEVNLVEKCPRSKLQQQCIKYLGPMERLPYEVVVEDGKLLYKQTGELVDTSEPHGAKWIFVLSTSMTLYVGRKKKGSFQHSSFLAGGATSAAGRLVVEQGILKAVWPHSGHYKPTPENFQDFVSFLQRSNVDLTDVQMDPVDEEDSFGKQNSVFLRSNSSEENLEEDHLEKKEIEGNGEMISEKTITAEEDIPASRTPRSKVAYGSSSRRLTDLTIPDKVELFESLERENQAVQSSSDGYESAEEQSTSEQDPKTVERNLSDEEEEEEGEETKEGTIPQESILQRINSHKGVNSYQLGKQISFKWTTGAGPRIGCLRDYPSELQFRTLEKENLSPRGTGCQRSRISSCMSSPASFSRDLALVTGSPTAEIDSLVRQKCRQFRAQSSPLRKEATVAANNGDSRRQSSFD